MYEYLDTNGHAVANVLPAEAVSINGTYLEDIVDGYRTLYVKGRESLGVSLNTYAVGTADGERVKNSRYPARTITVGFQLLCDSDEDFRQRFNQLNNILSLEEADFIFNDETDKYFTGRPIMDANIEAGRNNITGEWKIYCPYPFKRSTEIVTLTSANAVVDGNTATFTFDYDGVMPAKPLLVCEFASTASGGDFTEDGDCGFVAFVNQDGKIIQLGNPDVIDIDLVNKNGTLVNCTFDALTGWTASGYTVQSITDQHWARDTGQTKNFAVGGNNSTLSRSTDGAVGFEFDIIQRLCVSSPEQTGTFKCLLKNGNNAVVGYTIEKTGSGTSGTVKYIINNATVGTDTIDLSYNNQSFGYCGRGEVYTTERSVVYVAPPSGSALNTGGYYRTVVRDVLAGYFYTQSNLNSGISRDGSVVTFSVGNLPSRTFKRSAIENTVAYDVVFEATGDFNTNGVASCAFIRKAGVSFNEIPNVFTAGDIVEADCNSANVYLYRNGSVQGHLEPQYGALGNDWEDFNIKVGRNIIRAAWSDWTDASHKPTIKIIYNKVYI